MQQKLFPNLCDPSIFQIFGGEGVWERLKVPAKTQMIKEGTLGQDFYYICEGSACVEKGNTLLAHLKSGDFFGEGALISSDARGASISTMTDCVLLKLSKNTFETLLKNDSSAGLSLLLGLTKVLNLRLQASNERLIALYEIAAMMAKGRMDLNTLLKKIFEKLAQLGFGKNMALYSKEGQLVYVEACDEQVLSSLSEKAPHYSGVLRQTDAEASIIDSDSIFLAVSGMKSSLLGVLAIAHVSPLLEDEVRFLVVLSQQLGQVLSLFHEKDLS